MTKSAIINVRDAHSHPNTSKLTVIAVVDVDTVTVVEALEGEREILVELKVVRVLLNADAGEIRKKILVHLAREGLGSALLVVHRGMERQCVVHDGNDLHAPPFSPLPFLPCMREMINSRLPSPSRQPQMT